MAEKQKHELIPQETRERLVSVLKHCEDIEELVITNDDEEKACAEQVKGLSTSKRELEATRKHLVTPLNEQVKSINGEFKVVTSRLDNAVTVLKRGMGKYYQKKEAERIRKQQEAEAKAEEERRKAEAKAQKEREKAEEYRKQGREEMADKAEARADEAEEVAVTTVAEVVEEKKPEGVVHVDKWVANVEDKAAAVKACIDNPLLAEAVTLNTKVLERVRSATKTELPIPGIKWVKDTIVKTTGKGK